MSSALRKAEGGLSTNKPLSAFGNEVPLDASMLSNFYSPTGRDSSRPLSAGLSQVAAAPRNFSRPAAAPQSQMMERSRNFARPLDAGSVDQAFASGPVPTQMAQMASASRDFSRPLAATNTPPPVRAAVSKPPIAVGLKHRKLEDDSDSINQNYIYGTPYMPEQALLATDIIDMELIGLKDLYDAGFIQDVEYQERKMMLQSLKKHSFITNVPHVSYETAINSSISASSAGIDSNRNVRIFVSSTFRDMGAERDVLLKTVFPKIQRLCRERGVFCTAVDLRWGITSEQTTEGNTINVCLSEIDRCRPYFIGVLGNRYGWAQPMDGSVDELLKKTFNKAYENFEWLRKYETRSVTEVEIRHAVLNNMDSPAAQKARFYLRQNSERDDDPRLTALKEELTGYTQLRVTKYQAAQAMGEQVFKDIMELIDQDFPEAAAPTPLQRETMAHSAFQESRARIYIGRQQYFEAINSHLMKPAGPMCVVGESGSGKSAFMCNWTMRYRRDHPERFVLAHYIGSTAASSDLGLMLHRIMSEISERYKITSKSIPSDIKDLIQQFPEWLAEAGARGGVTLVLDALNQLDPRDNSHDLQWLPHNLPEGVKLVCSTLPGRCLDVVTERGWKTHKILPLSAEERKTMINEYMSHCGKTLTPDQLQLITGAPQCASPLFLRTLLEEIRVFGVFEQLTAKIKQYLVAQTPPQLFQLVFQRLEGDFETDSNTVGLVGRVLSSICVSRKGLTESELLSLLNINHAVWSPLFLSLEEALVSRSGYLTFFHDYMRQAVESRYLMNKQMKSAFRHEIIAYFKKQEKDSRFYEEVPFQLEQSGAFEELARFITQIDNFLVLAKGEFTFDLYRYWRSIPEHIQPARYLIASVEASTSNNKDFHTNYKIVDAVAGFLKEVGAYTEAEAIYAAGVSHTKHLPGAEKIHADLLDGLGYVYRLQGKYADAAEALAFSISVKEKLLPPNDPTLATAINSLAIVYRKQGKYDEAEKLYNRALEIRRALFGSLHVDIAQSYNSLGCLHQDMGRYEEAQSMLKEAIRQRELLLGSAHPDLAMSLFNLANVYLDWSKFAEAEPMYQRSLSIYVSVFGESHPYVAQVLNSMAGLYQEMGKYDNALTIYEKTLEMKRKLLGKVHPELALTLNDMAVLYTRLSEYDKAEEMYAEALDQRRQIVGEKHPDYAQALKNLASCYQDRGEYHRALPLFQQCLTTYETSLGPSHPNVASGLTGLAGVLQLLGRLPECIPLYERAIQIYKAMSDGSPDSDLALTLNDFAVLYFKMRNFPKAEETYVQALDTYESCFGTNHPDVAQALLNLGQFYKATGDAHKAKQYFTRGIETLTSVFGPSHERTLTAVAQAM